MRYTHPTAFLYANSSHFSALFLSIYYCPSVAPNKWCFMLKEQKNMFAFARSARIYEAVFKQNSFFSPFPRAVSAKTKASASVMGSKGRR